MRRHLILGLVILLAIPALGLWATSTMESVGTETAEYLLQARQAAVEGAPEQARTLARQAHGVWEKKGHLAACLWDHEGLDEITLGFRALDALCEREDSQEFGRVCMELAQRIRSLCQEQWPMYYNVL